MGYKIVGQIWSSNLADREFTKKYSLTGYSGYSISNVLGDGSGNVYIGYQNNSNVSRLSKINANNTVAWTKSYGFNYINLHAISSDGSQLLTAHANYENDTYMVINSSDGMILNNLWRRLNIFSWRNQMLASAEPKVYVVIEEYPFLQGFCMYKVFDNLASAEALCADLLSKLDFKNKPQFDDWGLTDGMNYRVITMELNK
jgi:hypothetical protein